MKPNSITFKLTLIGILLLPTSGFAASPELPVIDGKKTVATVNADPITLSELKQAIASSHAARSKQEKAGRIVVSDIMNRLINTRLIVLEARNMGLDELPELKSMVAAYSRETQMKVLLEELVKNVKADENVIEKLYQDAVKEWKIKSVLFEKEQDVKKAEEALKAGKSFEEIAAKAAAEGTAQISAEGEYLKNKDLTPNIARIVSEMEIGSVSPIVSVGKKGFNIFKLEGMRIPETDNPEARKQAQRAALNQKKVQTARDYYLDLRKKYVKLNQNLLDELDYESKEPGLEKLLEDKRVIAKIKGAKPITVAELSQALKNHFYHGVERAIESQRINKKKEDIFEDILQKRILLKEALKRDIDKTEVYTDKVKQYEYSLIFGAFIDKVVAPDIKLNPAELKAYYEENLEDYRTPEMIRVKSLAFGNQADAIEALEKLTQGTDFNWLSAQAGGQLDPNTEGLLKLEGQLLTVKGLPEGLQKALSQAKPGDFRLYKTPDGIYFYVLYIYHVVPPTQMPLKEVQKDIAKEVYNQKIKKMVDTWAGKLREYYPVKVYLSELADLEN